MRVVRNILSGYPRLLTWSSGDGGGLQTLKLGVQGLVRTKLKLDNKKVVRQIELNITGALMGSCNLERWGNVEKPSPVCFYHTFL